MRLSTRGLGAEGRTRTGTGVTRALLRRVRLPIPPLRQNGVPGEIRTPDLLIRSQTLYPAELRARAMEHE